MTLASRTGTEINTRDIAVGLLRRGHQPVVYSPQLGDMADEIRAATVPVVDDLTSIAAVPEVIHGHHHTPTMTALLRFPGVPALFFVHDWAGWMDEPLRFPRVQLYVPVDATNRDQLELEHGIPAERIRLVLNAVDLERFVPRPPLPPRPRRALVFSNYAAQGGHLAALREACASAGLELTVVGAGVGNSAVRPESVLPGFDLVFAKGRCALEALAVGCAVVLCDVHGLGTMVSSLELPRLRALNFGRRALQRPVTGAAVAAEIARYDAADAAAVSATVRAEAGLERQLDHLLGLYEEAIGLGAAATDDPVREGEAAARYLQRWLPRFGPPATSPSVRGVVVLEAREVVAL
ncbi:MAG TPA: glycosyltransferase family 4 protein, partial [Thermoanaerobaculia bacterium]|nr:glycosyltransferase family 4 protein [Thermoanaerobaculia bacterium]